MVKIGSELIACNFYGPFSMLTSVSHDYCFFLQNVKNDELICRDTRYTL
jgi:hypothetical protein